MENRTLELNLISAKDLNKVNFIIKMGVYVDVSISGAKTNSNQRTTVDGDGDTNPTWNFPMKFTILESDIQQNLLILVFKLRCHRSIGDKDVGDVHVPVKELLDSAGDGKRMQFVSYQVRKPSGQPKGELNFSYKFSQEVDKEAKVDKPFTAYPASAPVVGTNKMYPPPSLTLSYAAMDKGLHPPHEGYYPPPSPYMVADPGFYPPPGGYIHPPPPPHHVAGYGYPPPPYGGYPPPPPPSYGYPPQSGYGYPQVQQPQKKNKSGLGLGVGLLGGALGGLLIGDMV